MSIKLNCDVKVKHNFKKIDKIIKELPNTIKESVEDVLKNIQGYAIKLEKGNHEDGILVEMVDISNMEVKGRVYTSKEKLPFAMFEHWGTRTICRITSCWNYRTLYKKWFYTMVYPSK